MTIKDNPIDTTVEDEELPYYVCAFYEDGKCTKTYEEVKRMSLAGCYVCRYNPGRRKTNE